MMSKVIRISDSIFSRLQKLSTPLVDTPASVIGRMLDHYEQSDRLDFSKTSALPVMDTSIESSAGENYAFNEAGLYLAPANEENLQSTIIRSKPISLAESHLRQEQYQILQRTLKDKTEFHCWAMTRNSRSKFNAMKEGDWVLFTSKGTGRFSYNGRVICKLESGELGRALWSVVPGLPWELIYFLENVSRINVPKETLVSALGYDQGYVVPGIVRVSSARVRVLIDQHGSIPELISNLSA